MKGTWTFAEEYDSTFTNAKLLDGAGTMTRTAAGVTYVMTNVDSTGVHVTRAGATIYYIERAVELQAIGSIPAGTWTFAEEYDSTFTNAKLLDGAGTMTRTAAGVTYVMTNVDSTGVHVTSAEATKYYIQRDVELQAIGAIAAGTWTFAEEYDSSFTTRSEEGRVGKECRSGWWL